MSETIAVRLHGRGGQGTVTLAALLVDAAVESGWHALGFPSFGTERTGAPVTAFVRLSREPIRDRSEIRTPDVVVVQDPTLVGSVNVLEGLAPAGLVLINAARVPEQLLGVRALAVPVTTLAVRLLGAPRTSTAMLGVLARATGLISLEGLEKAIARRLPGEVGEANVELARAAFDEAARAVEAA